MREQHSLQLVGTENKTKVAVLIRTNTFIIFVFLLFLSKHSQFMGSLFAFFTIYTRLGCIVLIETAVPILFASAQFSVSKIKRCSYYIASVITIIRLQCF